MIAEPAFLWDLDGTLVDSAPVHRLALTDALADPDPAAAKRAFEAMMTMGKIDIAAIESARRG